MILFYSLGIISLIVIGIYYFIWKDKLNDKKRLEYDWQKFLMSVSENDIKGIAAFGDKLLWNNYLQGEQLNKIIHVVKTKISDFPELIKLEENARNKKLHYDRSLPYLGSTLY